MDPALARALPSSTPSFSDALGDRFLLVDRNGADALEMLVLRSELTSVPSFEFALRERMGRLANFRHAYYAQPRRVDRLGDDGGLGLVYEHAPGARLSEILAVAARDQLSLDISAALCLIRQLVPAVAMLHQNARDVAHGALTPERIVVTPHARVVVVEHVLGSALEQLRFSHDRLWREFGLPLPSSAGLPRFDHRADVVQIGLIALALVLGRPVADDEYPRKLGDVLGSASACSSLGGREPLAPALKTWLSRALQLDYRLSFHSAVEAHNALEAALADESGYIAAPVALETFLSRYEESVRAHQQPVAVPSKAADEAARAIELVPPPAEEPAEADAPASETPPERELFSVDPERLFREEPVKKKRKKDVSPERRQQWKRRRRIAIAAMAVLVLVEAVYLGATRFLEPAPTPPAVGTLVVESRPAGADVIIDGKVRGVTPLTLTLPPGPHSMELKASGGDARLLPITIQKGGQHAHYLELGAAAAAVTGQLAVRSEPAGARVLIAGQPAGITPVMVENLEPGEHEVTIESDLGSVRQTVQVRSGGTASLFVPLAAAPAGAPVSGWVSVAAPFEMQLFEGGRLIGTSQSERIMVAAGSHEIEIVNETLGYRATRTVQVPPGRVVPLRLDLPRGTLNLNAVPWAEVWIDGARVGETPLGNVAVPIGPHEIIFRNPQLGERRHAVTVTTAAPVRLSVDLRQ